jgi:hypothetical protein
LVKLLSRLRERGGVIDYKGLWCELYAELEERLGREPKVWEVDRALAGHFGEWGDFYRGMQKDGVL